ncbi:uncharacterized protein At5g19025-like isoform X2 [Papaver somniferum]|uniref:uncharacterized protein At5g19025-like isoform X2 n=1 Tax=Papaver somniferum TaxID=3469 RepID=UPI000E6F634D|nr:uncharacterized protein At5g19025-like isoform X2 [Papaver somniferum]
MVNHLFSLSSSVTTTTTMPSPSLPSSSSSHNHHHHNHNHHHHHQKPNKKTSTNTNPNNSSYSSSSSTLLCKHSPSATLDILILILVLFSCTFLITSYFSYILTSLSKIIPISSQIDSFKQSPFPYLLGFLIFFAVSVVLVEICCNSFKSRKCDNPNCKGLKKAMEFDIQLQTEDSLKKSLSTTGANCLEFDNLPWKGQDVVVLLLNLKLGDLNVVAATRRL